MLYAGIAVTDLDGTLAPGDTLCIPFYGCPDPYPGAVERLQQFDQVLYLSCKPSVYTPLQTYWLEHHGFPEGESWAIGAFPGGCSVYNERNGSAEKCGFLIATGIEFTHGFSEDEESLQAYRCAGIPHVERVP